MNNDTLISMIETSYQKINFAPRYYETMMNHNDFENRMQKVDKKEILGSLKDLGYSFKVFSPGQEFYIEEFISNFKFVFSFNAKNAIMANYIYVYYNGVKIQFPYSNLGFVYRYLFGDMELPIKAQNFKNYNEFKELISSLLQIYEDFKVEFLKQAEEFKL